MAARQDRYLEIFYRAMDDNDKPRKADGPEGVSYYEELRRRIEKTHKAAVEERRRQVEKLLGQPEEPQQDEGSSPEAIEE